MDTKKAHCEVCGVWLGKDAGKRTKCLLCEQSVTEKKKKG